MAVGTNRRLREALSMTQINAGLIPQTITRIGISMVVTRVCPFPNVAPKFLGGSLGKLGVRRDLAHRTMNRLSCRVNSAAQPQSYLERATTLITNVV